MIALQYKLFYTHVLSVTCFSHWNLHHISCNLKGRKLWESASRGNEGLVLEFRWEGCLKGEDFSLFFCFFKARVRSEKTIIKITLVESQVQKGLFFMVSLVFKRWEVCVH